MTETAIHSPVRRIETHAPTALVQHTEHSRLLPWLIFLAALAGCAIALSIFQEVESIRTERETRMLEYYIMELDGKLMKSGVLNPSDSWSARQERRK